MKILGISAFYHDSAAALVVDGEIIAAAHEERFTRIRHDQSFPRNATEFLLRRAGLALRELDAVVYYEKPFIKFERLLETYLAFAPRGFLSFKSAMPTWIKEKLFLRRLLANELRSIDERFEVNRIQFSEHHLSHAASAFFPSPYDKAIILTCDGVGEWCTTSLGIGDGQNIKIDREIHFPHSLGLLYSAFTSFCGFRVNSGEYKLMGLAPYGEPKHVRKIYDHLVNVKEDGSFRLNLEYFDYCTGLKMVSQRFEELWGYPALPAGGKITQFYLDLAASIQVVVEEILIKIVRDATRTYGRLPLVLSGGVALNCVANGRLLREGCVDQIWPQPAAGDAGGALGAALAYSFGNNERRKPTDGCADAMRGCYLGPDYHPDEIEAALRASGVIYSRLPDPKAVTERAAKDLAHGLAIGWHQGRSEYGPRALGNRSIIADARSPAMQSQLNLKIKFRESFRPFAPCVLLEDCAEWFDLKQPSPYMMLVSTVSSSKRLPLTDEQRNTQGLARQQTVRSLIPAVTHVDNTARVQTVDSSTNPLLHQLLSDFRGITGCPLLVNTSFNIRGEPMVETPADAIRCFLGTDLDRLYVGNFVLAKEEQPTQLRRNYRSEIEKD